jgi:NAD(P)-dependent dehydrogenase (short-subunit alcohol dehydrogenase family)
MARVFITGSADGLGRAAAHTLLNDGHEVVVHARNRDRLAAVRDLLDRGAAAVVGDLSDLVETRGVACDVNRLGRMDAVIHNAGVYTGRHVLPVNIVTPYLLTALIHRPQRLVYLTSGMHRGGRVSLTGIDWSGRRTTGSYPDSKRFVTTLAVAVARRWADVCSNAVDPGWVPTKMGDPVRPTICGSGTSPRSGLPLARIPTRAPPAATGITSAGPSRIPPSVTGGSRTSCSRTWLTSPPPASSDSCRIALSWSCETVVANGDLLGQAHVSTTLSMHKRR